MWISTPSAVHSRSATLSATSSERRMAEAKPTSRIALSRSCRSDSPPMVPAMLEHDVARGCLLADRSRADTAPNAAQRGLDGSHRQSGSARWRSCACSRWQRGAAATLMHAFRLWPAPPGRPPQPQSWPATRLIRARGTTTRRCESRCRRPPMWPCAFDALAKSDASSSSAT